MLQACSPSWAFLTTYFDVSRVCTFYCNCDGERGIHVSRSRGQQLYKRPPFHNLAATRLCYNTSSFDGGHITGKFLHYRFIIFSGHGFRVSLQSRKNQSDDEGFNIPGVFNAFRTASITSKNVTRFSTTDLHPKRKSKKSHSRLQGDDTDNTFHHFRCHL